MMANGSLLCVKAGALEFGSLNLVQMLKKYKGQITTGSPAFANTISAV